MTTLNLLDKWINYFYPEKALNRTRARYVHERFLKQRKYDAASKSRRTEGWYSPTTSANTEIAQAISIIRERSRDLVRNNAYAERAVRSLASNLVGAGIVPQARSTRKTLVRKLAVEWALWGETLACDLDGHHNFYGLQTLVVRTLVESGECLIRKCRRKSNDGLPLPLQLQILEPDFLDTSHDTLTFPLNNGHFIMQGVEFNAQGQRVAYWLFNEHPGGGVTGGYFNPQSQRVNADDIIHVYRVDRPGQIRGVPWGAPIIIKTKDLDDYDQAELVRHKIAACFAGFVRDTESVDAASENTIISDKFEPGILEILPPGKDITFSSPPQVQGYADYVNANLRAVAVGFGIPYEVLTGDYSQVNFSSSRMGWLEFQRNIEQWQWQLLIPRVCDRVWQWFNEAAIITGKIPEAVPASWTAPRREMIDPSKEVAAIREQVRAGFMTLSEAIRMFGFDPQEHFAQLAQDAQILDELGLVLDSDPRRTSQSGGAQPFKP